MGAGLTYDLQARQRLEQEARTLTGDGMDINQ
jgi:hypothetical protein